ncbi:hypothetical protein F5Y02DRAFT_400220 [Annulohypoxylon stygium]|nr:hypothetical protein F5Y02DRAFT_400220 [Annulohypoxylon stygium]
MSLSIPSILLTILLLFPPTIRNAKKCVGGSPLTYRLTPTYGKGSSKRTATTVFIQSRARIFYLPLPSKLRRSKEPRYCLLYSPSCCVDSKRKRSETDRSRTRATHKCCWEL